MNMSEYLKRLKKVITRMIDEYGVNENLELDEAITFLMDNQKDLQQKVIQLTTELQASQASEARLREALNKLTTDLSDRAHKHEQEDALAVVACGNSAWRTALKALSTPPNTTELEAHVESEIEKRLGEPVAWMKPDKSVCSSAFKNDPPHAEYASLFSIPLYARKDKQ
jgi:thymidine phosphorylase